MNISNIKPILSVARVANDTALMVGKAGIGKSDIVRQYSKDNNLGMKAIFLSMFEIGDLLGMPVVENGATIWAEPDWIMELNNMAWPDHFNYEDLIFNDEVFEKFISKEKPDNKEYLTKLYNEFYDLHDKNSLIRNQTNVSCKKSKNTLLFLDEFARANPDIHNAALQLVLEKRLHNHILPYVNGEQTQIVAADNPDDGDYHVNSLDPATKDRFLIIDVEHDPESWLAWARKNNVNKIVRDFIIDNQNKLHFTPEEEGAIGATPRSWTKLAKFVDNFDTLDEDNILHVIRGKVGSALASEFYLFYENYNNNISIEDIEKFIKKEYKKEKNFEILGEKVKEFTQDMENITKLEHINTLFDRDKEKLKDSETEDVDFLSIFIMLYSFEIELLTSFLKDKKANDKEAFYNLMKKDKKRELARKIKSKVQK